MPEYENWLFTKTSAPALDASLGQPLFTTGRRPRVLFQLAMYDGTNSNAVDFNIHVIPETSGLGIDANGQVSIAGDFSFSYGKVDSNLGGSSEVVPLQWAPWGTKGTTNGAWAAIIPPNCMVVATAVGATNGTVIVNTISAEM